MGGLQVHPDVSPALSLVSAAVLAGVEGAETPEVATASNQPAASTSTAPPRGASQSRDALCFALLSSVLADKDVRGLHCSSTQKTSKSNGKIRVRVDDRRFNPKWETGKLG